MRAVLKSKTTRFPHNYFLATIKIANMCIAILGMMPNDDSTTPAPVPTYPSGTDSFNRIVVGIA